MSKKHNKNPSSTSGHGAAKLVPEFAKKAAESSMVLQKKMRTSVLPEDDADLCSEPLAQMLFEPRVFRVLTAEDLRTRKRAERRKQRITAKTIEALGELKERAAAIGLRTNAKIIEVAVIGLLKTWNEGEKK